jgi:hypothetical protein
MDDASLWLQKKPFNTCVQNTGCANLNGESKKMFYFFVLREKDDVQVPGNRFVVASDFLEAFGCRWPGQATQDR